ncbi:hypothetical protein MtrunA17_Chr3g0105321 [Medicago truncatula]|uniref:Uncharacterized protein n=1 Tax=Medicago truncatula TaxID=3880 RepID=A0A396IT69_MEDTR|nr:hypothetical protein MtrunA17_Chr3g0105321 [Medicago truncatula]
MLDFFSYLMHIFSCVQEFVKARWLFNTNFFGEVHSSMETSLKKVKLHFSYLLLAFRKPPCIIFQCSREVAHYFLENLPIRSP